MASTGSGREIHLLTTGILRLDCRYGDLPLPSPILQMFVTNLRNRPVSSVNIESMRESILRLYHNLITGSKKFPFIAYRGSFRSCVLSTPFQHIEQERRENTALSPLMEGPSGIMAPTARSGSSPQTVLTPVLPEKADLAAVRGDRRNCVHHLELDGRTITRVISPVYSSENTELMNRWRLTDYTADGHTLMSVLCRFTKQSTQCAKTQRERMKRKAAEEESSSSSSSSLTPPKKRLRV
ncbi:uncharacterized protein LOC122973017 [Thunnus albacares]|uniref:uncharacterized protein LOC122973017 n=1 Tax=Thunnus albacares TaxID=8236 RepID=UPI001CF6D79A|nr:uncharacterized protein LOC122973017 [Thunnus albacares]